MLLAPLMQVKSLRAEAAQSCSTQLPLHGLLGDDEKQREMSLAISYKMSSLASPVLTLIYVKPSGCRHVQGGVLSSVLSNFKTKSSIGAVHKT